jgi:hypothetical protein
VPGVEGDQPAGGVEHVGRGGVGAVGVADDVGEHGAGAGGLGEPEQPAGAGGVAVRPVRDDLDDHGVAAQHVAPAVEVGAGEVVAPRRHRPADLRRRAEQDGERPGLGGGAGVLGDELEAADGRAALTGEVGGRHQPAQRRPAPAVAGQQHHPREPVGRRATGTGTAGGARVG